MQVKDWFWKFGHMRSERSLFGSFPELLESLFNPQISPAGAQAKDWIENSDCQERLATEVRTDKPIETDMTEKGW